MQKYIHMTWALLALLLFSPGAARAQSESDIRKARDFLENNSRAKGILFFAHPEAKFQDIKHLDTKSVIDGQRKPVAGHFALIYEFSWKSGLSGDTNTTELVFFFDKGGRFYAMNASRTTSFFQPFEVADVVIREVRDQIIRKVDQEGTDSDKKLVRTLIQNADSRGLLTLVLRLDQK